MQAGLVVKLVMIALVAASIWVWAIIIEKSLKLRKLNRSADQFEDVFWSGKSFDEIYEVLGERSNDPMSAIFASAMHEWHKSSHLLRSGSSMGAALQDRLERVMNVTLGREMDRAERNMTFLASTGATAPFVGLFGTVWGIMTAFQDIALSKNTSLAVVAPGIAEALLATAIGLVAAIPAVIAYNKLSTDLGRYQNRLEAFADEFSAIMSRELSDNERRG
jgi:biopolymer transport protein TolQ